MQKVALNKVCELFSGFPLGSKDFAQAGSLSVVQLRDVDKDGITLPDDLQRTDKAISNQRKMLKYGDILFKARGPRLEALALPMTLENTIATNAFIILRPKAEIYPRYIAWVLNSMNFGRIIQQTHVIQSVSLSQLADVEVPMPDQETQSKIVGIQDEIEHGQNLADHYFEAASTMLRAHVFSN